MAVRGDFDNTCHLKSIDRDALKVNDSDTVYVNGTENNGNYALQKGSTEFLVKYRDRVYNIYNFLNYHPGGKNTLLRFKDQILDKELAKNHHSKSAYYLLEEYAVQHQDRYNEYEVSDI